MDTQTIATHTPGPWGLGVETCDESAQVIANDGNHICTVEQHPIEANARLIAAAPDLLAALEALQRELRQHVKLNVRKHYSLMVSDAAANAAIAKAKGIPG